MKRVLIIVAALAWGGELVLRNDPRRIELVRLGWDEGILI